MKKKLEDIDIKEPCFESWDDMPGDDLRRHCSSCEKDVFNLSGMPRKTASKLLRRRDGRICVRFAKTNDGRVVTKERSLYQISRTPVLAAGVIAAGMSLATVTYSQGGIPLDRRIPKSEIQAGTERFEVTVVDPTGVIVPGATVSYEHIESKILRTTTTGEDGVASLVNPLDGEYEVTITASGFKKFVTKTLSTRNLTSKLQIQIELAPSEITVVVGGPMGPLYEDPVLIAISDGETDVFEAALRQGFDVNTKDDSTGRSALLVAIHSEEFEFAKKLINLGADVNFVDDDGESPLLVLSESFGENDVDLIKLARLLISYGADVNTKDSVKMTPLMYAAFYDDPKAVELLLASGADYTLKNESGKTARAQTDDDEVLAVFDRFSVFE